MVYENENKQVTAVLVKDDYIIVKTFENKDIFLKITNKDGALQVEKIENETSVKEQ